MTKKSATAAISAMEAQEKRLEKNLCQLEKTIMKISELVEKEPIDVGMTEVEILLAREQHKTVIKLIEKYIEQLLAADLDFEVECQLQRKTDLIRNIGILERYCSQKLGNNTTSQSGTTAEVPRVSKLPKRELPKFDGNVRDWMGFWSAFEEIHNDKRLTESEKLHYLLQHTVVDSAAYKVVKSFPPSGSNYQSVVDRLKERFGRKKTLIKVYMRDLLKMVVENSTSESKTDFVDLVTALDSQMRNLAQLGVTQDKFGELLYPVVESCIPGTVLDGYMRTPGFKEELPDLMEFLQNEVRRRIETGLAKSQFAEEQNKSTAAKSGKNHEAANKNVKTAAGFLNAEDKSKKTTCLFCDRPNHRTSECRTAVGWTFEQKKEALKKNRGCFKCLNRHNPFRCKEKVFCSVCGKNHHVMMCMEVDNKKSADSSQKQKKEQVDTDSGKEETQDDKAVGSNPTKPTMTNVIPRPEVLMQTLTVWVHGPTSARKARAAYDSFSQSSYIKDELARELSLPVVGKETVSHQTFGGVTSKPQTHPIYKMELAGLEEGKKYCYEICGIPKISGAIDHLPRGAYIEECMRKGITLTDLNNYSSEIEILIGADFGDELKVDGTYMKLETGPVAIHTKIGWVLSGMLKQPQEKKKPIMMHLNSNVNDKNIANLWSLETIGIEDPVEVKSREEIEKSALDHFQKTVTQDNTGRYSVHLPWIEGHRELPDNKVVSIKRLQTTTEMLKKTGFLHDYDLVIKTWIQDNRIEKADPSTTTGCHYLPHRAVIKEGSTTPIRPVFDASSKARNQPSLNECLEKGPNLLELIPAIITRFRLDRVGVVADIKKAFQQMIVVEKDRDVLRFLWWNDVKTCKDMVELRHVRVVFGVAPSPFFLGAVIQHHLKKYNNKTSKKLTNSFYVDNAVLSVPSITAAEQFKEEASAIMSDGQFDLRGWEFGPSTENRDVPVLGMIWNLKEDNLKFDVKNLTANQGVNPTKRNLYKLLNMLYDPMGFAAPFVVVGKVLLKKVCAEEKIGWDEPLKKENAAEFEKWKNQLTELKEVRIPRCVFANDENIRLSLECFCDASKDCFASCVFLRVSCDEGIKVYLLQAKTRVSPKKGVTIPRLELLSCLIGARLVASILKDIGRPITTRHWTDSTTALTWIQKDETWATFVNNRVKQIRELSDPQKWAHIAGSLNPADLPSRGCTVKRLLELKWWEGPSWLTEEDKDFAQVAPLTDYIEVNKEKKKVVVSAVNAVAANDLDDKLLSCGNYQKVLRALVRVLRCTKKLDKPAADNSKITVEELEVAERYLLRYIQRSMGNIQESMKNVELIKDEFGLYRVRSRMTYGEDPECFKYPVILNGKHPLVKLLIFDEHELACHAGVQYLQNRMREKYWLIESRRSIRNVVHKCAICRLHLAKRIQVPEAALPVERINTTKVFAVTGVDVTGPLFVEKGQKMWVVLFTCAVYRAVHMELVSSMSTEAFLQAFQKFVARRGRPHTVFSDNGTNFTGCSHLLKSVNWEEVQQYAILHRIRWRFNPPTAAWWGGWWERLIGLVKQLLRRVLGSRFVKRAYLEVLITEVEAIMNDRPLTYISDDAGDLRPLTPSCFLRDLPVAALPEIDLADGKGLRINLKKIQKMKQELRDRFRKEYLGQLIHRRKGRKCAELLPGSVVLIEVDNHKRIDWPMGVVMETFPGPDGHSRVAKIKTTKGVMTRPLQRLFLLEVKTMEQDIPVEVIENMAAYEEPEVNE